MVVTYAKAGKVTIFLGEVYLVCRKMVMRMNFSLSTLHRSMLLSCEYLSPESVKPKTQECKTQNPPIRNHPKVDTCSTSHDEEF